MTNHMQTKNKIKKITKTAFNEMLDEAMLTDTEKLMLKMYYIEHKDFGYIADTLGYSLTGARKMHQRILKQIESLL